MEETIDQCTESAVKVFFYQKSAEEIEKQEDIVALDDNKNIAAVILDKCAKGKIAFDFNYFLIS